MFLKQTTTCLGLCALFSVLVSCDRPQHASSQKDIEEVLKYLEEIKLKDNLEKVSKDITKALQERYRSIKFSDPKKQASFQEAVSIFKFEAQTVIHEGTTVEHALAFLAALRYAESAAHVSDGDSFLYEALYNRIYFFLYDQSSSENVDQSGSTVKFVLSKAFAVQKGAEDLRLGVDREIFDAWSLEPFVDQALGFTFWVTSNVRNGKSLMFFENEFEYRRDLSAIIENLTFDEFQAFRLARQDLFVYMAEFDMSMLYARSLNPEATRVFKERKITQLNLYRAHEEGSDLKKLIAFIRRQAN